MTRPPRTAGRRLPTRALAAAVLALTLTPLAGISNGPGGAAAQAADVPFPPQLVMVDIPTGVERARLQRLGLDLTEHAGHGHAEVVLHRLNDLTTLAGSGLTYRVKIPDLIARGVEIQRLDAAYAARVGTSPLPSGRTGYRTLADYESDMTGLAKRYPSLVRTFTLARPSLDGRPVRAVEIGRGVKRPNSGQPTFLLMGLHHAREWPSGELAMEFAIDLAQSYGKNKRITDLLDRARVVVVPVVNVDGFHYSRTDGEFVDLRDLNELDPLDGTGTTLLTPGRAYQRKNCRLVDGTDTPDGSCRAALLSPGGFGLGVDLNRNYGGFWGGPGAGTGLADPTYRGAGPFSEPETRNIRDLIRTRQVTMLISNHTFSNLILRPNGVNPATIGADGKPVGDAPDEQALKKLGAAFAENNGYANIHGWQLYDTTGTTEDYSYNATGGFGYTFEIGPDEFHPPFEDVVGEYLGTGRYAGKGNRGAYLEALAHTVSTKASGLLTGEAAPGTVLRLRKTFTTPTWQGGFADFVDTTMRVPASGAVSWLVNPSTRPVVQPRPYQQRAAKPFVQRRLSGDAPAAGSSADRTFVLKRAADALQIDLDWATPDDLDLVVFRKVRGRLVEVGSSGNAPAEKESVTVTDAARGTYVVRVVNYASLTPSYDLRIAGFDARTRTTQGSVERYTLTCERGGRVLDSQRVLVERGETVSLDLSACRR